MGSMMAKNTTTTTKRTMPRARLALPIRLGEIEAETLNVSPGGCALLLDDQPPRELHFALRLRTDLLVEGTARVVTCIEYGGRYYVSLSFAHLDTIGRPQLIDAVLKALTSG